MAYAPWGRRAAALVIDFLLMQPYFIIGFLGEKLIGGTGGAGFMYFCAGLGIWANFYNKCILMGRTGQSWGKRIMGFDLLLADGDKPRPMGLWKAVVREAAHMADILTLGVGYLFPIWDRRRQTFADKIMNTVTLRHEAAVSPSARAPQAVYAN